MGSRARLGRGLIYGSIEGGIVINQVRVRFNNFTRQITLSSAQLALYPVATNQMLDHEKIHPLDAVYVAMGVQLELI